MSDNLLISLQITLVGMGLVFAAIILLWGIMALLVRLVKDPSDDTGSKQGEPSQREISEIERKQRAALAAVTIALARRSSTMEPHEFPLPPTALVSAWQAIMRTRMLNKRGRK